MNIEITVERTEYRYAENKYSKNVAFNIDENSVVISDLDEMDDVLYQTEISREDFVNIAKLILNYG